MGTESSFLWLKWPEYESDHSASSSAEIKNAWKYASTPPLRLNGMCLGKERDDFTSPSPYCFLLAVNSNLFYSDQDGISSMFNVKVKVKLLPELN